MTSETSRKRTLGVLLFPGFELLDVFGPLEAFGIRPAQEHFETLLVAEKVGAVESAQGPKAVAEADLDDSRPLDFILVPGGFGTRKEASNSQLLEWIVRQARDAERVMSVCTGAFILAKAGLLDGLTATTVSHAIDELGKFSPKTNVVTDQRYVDNGKIITTAGLSSGIDGAFHLIAKIKGKGEAQVTALGMEYQWDPDSKFARAF